MATIGGLEKMSYLELLKLEERIVVAIAARRSAEAQATKDQLRDLAEKAGFNINELFGRRRTQKGAGEIKFRNPKDPSQTWTGRGRKPNWLVDAVKKGTKLDGFKI